MIIICLAPSDQQSAVAALNRSASDDGLWQYAGGGSDRSNDQSIALSSVKLSKICFAFKSSASPRSLCDGAGFEKAGGLDLDFHFMLDHQLWLKIAAQGPMIYVNETWSAARFHPLAKNRAQAPGSAREAFRVLDWAETQSDLAPILQRVQRRARASVQRVNARYLLDDGQSWNALKAWMRALIHPSADGFGACKPAWLVAVEFNRNESNPRCHSESQTKSISIR